MKSGDSLKIHVWKTIILKLNVTGKMSVRHEGLLLHDATLSWRENKKKTTICSKNTNSDVHSPLVKPLLSTFFFKNKNKQKAFSHLLKRFTPNTHLGPSFNSLRLETVITVGVLITARRAFAWRVALKQAVRGRVHITCDTSPVIHGSFAKVPCQITCHIKKASHWWHLSEHSTGFLP